MQKKCAELMQSLTAGGEYTITEDMKAQLADFYGNYCTEDETAKQSQKSSKTVIM